MAKPKPTSLLMRNQRMDGDDHTQLVFAAYSATTQVRLKVLQYLCATLQNAMAAEMLVHANPTWLRSYISHSERGL